jgi:hypothetical protein
MRVRKITFGLKITLGFVVLLGRLNPQHTGQREEQSILPI